MQRKGISGAQNPVPLAQRCHPLPHLSAHHPIWNTHLPGQPAHCPPSVGHALGAGTSALYALLLGR